MPKSKNHMSGAEFEALVRHAVETLPEPVRRRLDNLLFVVERRPSRKTRRAEGLGPGETLYGLYEGVPLIERSPDDLPRLPDRILIYRDPIEADYGPTRDAIAAGVRETIEHEVGHYLGMSEEDLKEHGLE